ncbi:MAG: hypothetical protein AABZ06_02545 [Bdellovibrionota bacterium]
MKNNTLSFKLISHVLLIAAVNLSIQDNASAEDVINVSTKRNPRIPMFHLNHPNWSVELVGSVKAFGGNNIVSDQGGYPVRAVSLGFSYQPNFLQSIGVISLGPTLSVYPISNEAGIMPTQLSLWSSRLSLWSIGGVIQYQARFFREQPIVPVFGFSTESLKYTFTGDRSGRTMAQGPFFGIYVLLNILDPSGAAEFYVNTGILRSYLVAELRNITGGNDVVSITGQSLFFGLRLEL